MFLKFEKIYVASSSCEGSAHLKQNGRRIVENVVHPTSPLHDVTMAQATTSPPLPFLSPTQTISLETPTSSSSVVNNNNAELCPTKRELGKNFSKHGNESDDEILHEYAAAARLAAEMENESDEELFSLKYTSLLPGGAVSALTQNTTANSQGINTSFIFIIYHQ